MKALDRARDGDMLRIHRGRYREAVTIDKRVKLVGVGKHRPVIDARCASPTTIDVIGDGVRLHRLKVVGADIASEVTFDQVSGARATNLVVRDTCDAEYGINVFGTGSIRIADSRAHGFDDAGFYIGEVTGNPGGPVRLRRSKSYGNLRGLIVENSAGGDIRVARNEFHDNEIAIPPALPTGVLITNSDGVSLERNEVVGNGRFGLHLTANSDGNLIDDNRLVDNPVDVRNEGSGNCGSGNQFTTGDPLPPC